MTLGNLTSGYRKWFAAAVLVLLAFEANSQTPVADPNGYFRDRKWTLSHQGREILVVSTYQGEPVQRPNQLVADLICSPKQRVSITKGLKYCGIDSVQVIGNQVELMLTDYDIKDPRGYCRIKRTVKLPLPSCP